MDGNQNNLQSILIESNTLLNFLTEFHKKVTVNEDAQLLKIGRFNIAKDIIPYLNFEDITKFRLSCKDINYSCSSTVALVAYYKSSISKQKIKSQQNPSNITFKQFEDIDNRIHTI